ncbi:ParB family chromosome partitioning protein [Azospirillum fermentarium]|uniref:ParB/RepB/Spo0J family partition protein n=1 Tax=Azospirillum fermentarium TaxID=1233114 RepID=UPI002227A021|nr:ParB/RepB/Spo0J family partition protein [Azospirillum fermentarium]MCW2247446.1 ParB family chromosome partitioning protein [Azospirillum fermentarium]
MTKPKTARNVGLFRTAMESTARDALFGTASDFPRLIEIDLARIHPNPHQPRRFFDPDDMASLAQSIERHGLKQPILVQEQAKGDYILVAGERRFRAHEMLGRDTIFAIVTSGDTDELALVENVQRVDLSALELAEALARLMDTHHYTQEELGGIVGKSQSYVSHTLRLNSLPARIKQEYASSHRDVSRSVLVEVAWVKDEAEQLALWDRVKNGAKTVKDARASKAGAEPAGAAVPAPVTRLMSSVKRLNKQVGAILPHRDSLGDEERAALRILHRQLTELLGDEAV